MLFPVLSSFFAVLSLSFFLGGQKEVNATEMSDLPPEAFPIVTDSLNVFSVSRGTLTQYYGDGGDVVVPAFVNGEKVTALGGHTTDLYRKESPEPEALEEGEEQVEEPEENIEWVYVESVDQGVFGHPTPSDLELVGTTGNFDLRALVLPDTLEKINSYSIAYSQVEYVYFGNGLKSIAPYGFYHCDRIKSVTLPDSITVLEEHSFYNCWSLTNIYIPPTVTTIHDGFIAMDHFQPSDYLTVVGYDNSQAAAYAQRVGANFVSLGYYDGNPNTAPQFDFQWNQGEINLYKGVGGAIGLPAVFQGENLSRVGGRWDTIYLDGYPLFEGMVGAFSRPVNLGMGYLYTEQDHNNVTKVTIPDSVETIGGALEVQSAYPSSIGWGAFAFSPLSQVNLGSSLKSVEDLAFFYNNLITLQFPNTLQTIGEYSFTGSTNLRQVMFTGALSHIGTAAFASDYFDTSVVQEHLVFYGYDDSPAQGYAAAYGIPYVSLGEIPIGYEVYLQEIGEGWTSVYPLYPQGGEWVTLEPQPISGLGVQKITVKNTQGEWIDSTWNSLEGTATYCQPEGNVEVTVYYGNLFHCTYDTPKNGNLFIAESEVAEGAVVKVYINPEDGYALDEVVVKDKGGNVVPCGFIGQEGYYQYVQPASSVHVTASYSKVGRTSFPPEVQSNVEGVTGQWSNEAPLYGEKVGFSFTMPEGYFMQTLRLWDQEGNPVDYWRTSEGTYVYVQPKETVIVEVTVVSEEEVLWSYGDLTREDEITPWAAYVLQEEIMSGTGSETFGAQHVVTRGMVAVVLSKLSGEFVPTAKESQVQEFLDVAVGEWYSDGVIWCKERGIVAGYEDGNFGVNDPVTREQLLLILYGFANYHELEVNRYEEFGKTQFVALGDLVYVSDFAEKAVIWGLGEGYFQDLAYVAHNVFHPTALATRSDFAQFLSAFFPEQKELIVMQSLSNVGEVWANFLLSV